MRGAGTSVRTQARPGVPGPAFTRAASRRRWSALPPSLRSEVEATLGAAVVSARSQPGGFTPGLASRLLLDDGTRAFAKALPDHDELAGDLHAEARCARYLPAAVPAPRLRLHLAAHGWRVLVFDDVVGRHPDLTDAADRRAVLKVLADLPAQLTPNPVPGLGPAGQVLGPVMTGWRAFAEHGPPEDLHPWARRHLDRLAALEAGWAAACAGNTLLHADLRPDNLLVTPAGRVSVVDWACACVGAPWADLVWMLGSVAEVDAEAVVRTHPLTRGVDPPAVDAVLAALAGCWEYQSRLPAVPTSVHLRPFQARNARLTRAWLAARTGWR